ncbi:anion permease [Campylobacter jejuni]|nr:anion permease [Campylobacter jejuni]EJP6018990.1 anion permease [Campylobacter jejuni]
MARGVIKTGLGEHLAYHFISILGKKTLGIAYSIAFCETILAPVTPSNTARAGAIINPIVQVIARSFKSTPNASTFAKDKLKELVKMKNSEKIMLSVFVSLLLLWAGALGLFFWNFS